MRFPTALLALALLPAGLTATADTAKDDGQCPVHRDHASAFLAGQSPVKMVDATYLGVITEAIPLQRADDLQLPRGTGLSVVAVAPDSPAAKAGIQPGDVFCKLNDQRLVNPAQLRVLVRLLSPKDDTKIQLVRKGKPETLTVNLGTRQLPEISPGGEEPRMFMPQNNGRMNAIPFSFSDGAMPKDMLRQLPKEFREQMERLGRQHPHAGDKAGAKGDDAEGSVIIDGLGSGDDDAETKTFEGSAALDGTQAVPGGFHFSSKIISNDGSHTIEVTHGDDNRLRITDKDGKELYNGKIPANDKEWEKVPNEVRAKARTMAKQSAMHIQGAPAADNGKPGQSF